MLGLGLNLTSITAALLDFVRSGLKMWLPFEKSGSDSSGNSNNATLYTGKALSFDGANDYVDLGVQSNPATNMTFACWLNPVVSASTSYQTIIDYGRFNAWLEDNDTLVIYTNTSGAAVNYTISDLNNKWSRLVVSVSGTTTSVYIDGTLISAKTTTALSGSAATSNIGRDGTTRFFEGKLSDVQVYDVAWTQADVTFDYNNPQHLVTDRAASSIALSNLKGYWHLSEGDGAINYDSSGEGNNGTINGATWVNQQATIPQLGLMDWAKITPVADEITLISDPNDPSKDILDNTVRLREHSLNLDGSGYAEVADDDSINPTSNTITVACWVYWNETLSNGTRTNDIGIVSKWKSSTEDYMLIKGTDTTFDFYIGTDFERSNDLEMDTPGWVYIAGTYDGSTIKTYKNGVSNSSGTSVSRSIPNTAQVLEIGRYRETVDRSYPERIDEVKIYERALSADELLQNYNAGLSQHKPGSAFSNDFSSDYGL